MGLGQNSIKACFSVFLVGLYFSFVTSPTAWGSEYLKMSTMEYRLETVTPPPVTPPTNTTVEDAQAGQAWADQNKKALDYNRGQLRDARNKLEADKAQAQNDLNIKAKRAEAAKKLRELSEDEKKLKEEEVKQLARDALNKNGNQQFANQEGARNADSSGAPVEQVKESFVQEALENRFEQMGQNPNLDANGKPIAWSERLPNDFKVNDQGLLTDAQGNALGTKNGGSGYQVGETGMVTFKDYRTGQTFGFDNPVDAANYVNALQTGTAHEFASTLNYYNSASQNWSNGATVTKNPAGNISSWSWNQPSSLTSHVWTPTLSSGSATMQHFAVNPFSSSPLGLVEWSVDPNPRGIISTRPSDSRGITKPQKPNGTVGSQLVNLRDACADPAFASSCK